MRVESQWGSISPELSGIPDNSAGCVLAAWPVALTATQMTLGARGAFCAKSSVALRAYLDKQIEAGVITPAERKALGR